MTEQRRRRRDTSSAEDAAFLGQVWEDATRNWRVGDRCAPGRGTATTTVVGIDGDHIALATGETVHRTRMRRPVEDR
jgi:hypothetical protein